MELTQTQYYIAVACHEANKVWCEANGDFSQKHWYASEGWQQDSAINGVKFRLENPNARKMRNTMLGWKTKSTMVGFMEKLRMLKRKPILA